MEKLFETIHLGQKILHFNVPIEIVDEINLTYQNNVKDLKEHNQYLAGKIKDEHKIDKNFQISEFSLDNRAKNIINFLFK